jgi:two-component system, cell cycle sensor histidine kinase and response regulator CckA
MGKEAQESKNSETILLVDDDTRIRQLARRALEQAGYTVLDAEDGEEALRLGQESAGAIRLLLTDLVMPGMNGRILAGHLQVRYPEMRVLYMSGYKDYAIGVEAVLEPDANYLNKPFTPDALVRAVREVLRHNG